MRSHLGVTVAVAVMGVADGPTVRGGLTAGAGGGPAYPP